MDNTSYAVRIVHMVEAYGSNAADPVGVPAIGAYGLSRDDASGDIQQRLVSEMNQIRATMDPATQKKFEETVYIYNTQRGNISGDVDAVLANMHPWSLQRLVQKFRRLSAVSMTPGT